MHSNGTYPHVGPDLFSGARGVCGVCSCQLALIVLALMTIMINSAICTVLNSFIDCMAEILILHLHLCNLH